MFEPEASIELLETESVFERLVAALLASGSVEEGAPAGEPGAPSAEPPVDEPPVDEPPAGEPPVDAPAFGDEPPVDAPEAGDQYAAPGVTGQGPRPEQVSADVVAVQQAVEALRRRAPSGRPGDVSALLGLRNSLDGLVLQELAEMEVSGGQLAVGAVTAATWLRDDQRISDVSARAQVRLGTRLREELPGLGALLREGRTTEEHARAALAGVAGLDPVIVRDCDEAICALVSSADPAAVRAQLRERAEAVDPELGRDAERRAEARRGFTVDRVGNGAVLGGSLGAEGATIVLAGLDLAVRQDRQDGDERSLAQRRADVLIGWARAEMTARGGDAVREDLRSVRAQLHVVVTLEQLEAAARRSAAGGLAGQVTGGWAPGDADGLRVRAGGSLGEGLLVSQQVLRRLACDASVALHARGGEAGRPAGAGADDELPANPLGLRRTPRPDPLYVGRAARIVTAAQWRALVVRDRHCVVKGCR
ncbi:MAG TPA: DUF222 domain-containing protein, partial [Mycobacteriales bacterium]|nr:DUF222 domain-containing protein [Mycobacteriales bacterium]